MIIELELKGGNWCNSELKWHRVIKILIHKTINLTSTVTVKWTIAPPDVMTPPQKPRRNGRTKLYPGIWIGFRCSCSLSSEIYSYFHVGADIFITRKTLTVTNTIPALSEGAFYQDISFLDLQLSGIIPHESQHFVIPSVIEISCLSLPSSLSLVS